MGDNERLKLEDRFIFSSRSKLFSIIIILSYYIVYYHVIIIYYYTVIFQYYYILLVRSTRTKRSVEVDRRKSIGLFFNLEMCQRTRSGCIEKDGNREQTERNDTSRTVLFRIRRDTTTIGTFVKKDRASMRLYYVRGWLVAGRPRH